MVAQLQRIPVEASRIDLTIARRSASSIMMISQADQTPVPRLGVRLRPLLQDALKEIVARKSPLEADNMIPFPGC